jgi:DNA polymerase-3 subunit alpha
VFELVDNNPNKYLPTDEIEKHFGKEVNVLGHLIVANPVCTVKKRNHVLS